MVVVSESEPQRVALLFGQADKDNDGELTKLDLENIFLDFDIDSEP